MLCHLSVGQRNIEADLGTSSRQCGVGDFGILLIIVCSFEFSGQ